MAAPESIQKLVEKFSENREAYRSGNALCGLIAEEIKIVESS